MRPSMIPNLSLMTLARGARQLVVQDALERISMSLVYFSRLTPQTNMGASAEGAELSIFSTALDWEYSGDKHDNFLSTTFQVGGRLLLGGEDTSRLNDVLGTSVPPWDVGGVTLLIHLDGLSIDDEVAGLIGGDLALEVSVG